MTHSIQFLTNIIHNTYAPNYIIKNVNTDFCVGHILFEVLFLLPFQVLHSFIKRLQSYESVISWFFSSPNLFVNSVFDSFWAFTSNSVFLYLSFRYISLYKIIFMFSSYFEENLNFKSRFPWPIYFTLFFIPLQYWISLLYLYTFNRFLILVINKEWNILFTIYLITYT